MPKEREAGICVPEVGGGERDTCREGQRQVRTARESQRRTENWPGGDS